MSPQSAYHKLREKDMETDPPLPGAAAMDRAQVTEGSRAAPGTAPGVLTSAASHKQLFRVGDVGGRTPPLGPDYFSLSMDKQAL